MLLILGTFLAFVAIVVGIILAVLLPIYFTDKKYNGFVDNHSVTLKKVKEINKRFAFRTIPNFDMRHKYDNVDFFRTVSPKDYLTYELNYQDKKVLKALSDCDFNKLSFPQYKKELSLVEYGESDQSTDKYDLKKLAKYEKERVRKILKSCQTRLTISVVLIRTNINGYPQARKSQKFQEGEIREILSRLHNKRNGRYLDEQIWNALVRVERAKVSNKMRFFLYKKYGEKCCKCGSRRNLQIDHIYPIAKGGKTTIDNLQVLCERCNKKKGAGIVF